MTQFPYIDYVRGWCFKVLPLVYDDSLSYYEQIRRFNFTLNEVIKNVNDLPKYIADLIEQFITSGAIDEVVRDILANYILNVKYPPAGITPATGDGTANDTEAIQGCINYASEHGGGAVYFPAGKYLTSSLTVPHDVSLFGFDRYTTHIVLAGGADQPLISINGMGHTLAKLTFDGNSGIQVNDVDCINIKGADILMTELVIDDCYVGLDFSGTNGHLQMSDIIFGSCVKQAALIMGDATVQAQSLQFNSLSAVAGENVIEIHSNRGSYQFTSKAKCELCMDLSGNDNFVDCQIVNAQTDYVDTGLRNNVEVRGVSQQEYLTENKEEIIKGSRSINVDMGNSENIGGNDSKVVNGNRSMGVEGTLTESFKGLVTIINQAGKTETTAGKHTTNSQDWVVNAEKAAITASSILFNGKEKIDLMGDAIGLYPKNPLIYSKVVDNKVEFTDVDGNSYYLITDHFNKDGNTLISDFLSNPITKYTVEDFAGDNKYASYTSDQFYALYDTLDGLIKTNIGTDNEGKIIYAYTHTAYGSRNARISRFLNNTIDRNAIMIVSGQHGIEKQQIISLFRWIKDEFSKESSFVLNNYDLFIIPCMSPTNIDLTRYLNANGVNPNRNFPVGFTPGTITGPSALSEKQCLAVYNYLKSLIEQYGLSLMVMNLHNSEYNVRSPEESRVLWYNINNQTIETTYIRNIINASASIKDQILNAYPELEGPMFSRILATDIDGTLGAQCTGMGLRFVLMESPTEFTDGVYTDQKCGYINYLILYNTLSALFANNFYNPRYQHFWRLRQIGCTQDNTLQEVCDALPIDCTINCLLSPSQKQLNSQLPPRNNLTGILSISKEHETNRCSIRFTSTDTLLRNIEWLANYDSDYGLSSWTTVSNVLTNVNFNMGNITMDVLKGILPTSAVLRILTNMPLASILPVNDSGMLFVYLPALPEGFSAYNMICWFVGDHGRVFVNNNSTPTSDNWIELARVQAEAQSQNDEPDSDLP